MFLPKFWEPWLYISDLGCLNSFLRTWWWTLGNGCDITTRGQFLFLTTMQNGSWLRSLSCVFYELFAFEFFAVSIQNDDCCWCGYAGGSHRKQGRDCRTQYATNLTCIFHHGSPIGAEFNGCRHVRKNMSLELWIQSSLVCKICKRFLCSLCI